MDKFGIFKLLNSFLTFLGQKQSDSTQNSAWQNDKQTSNSNTSDVVSNLIKSLSNNSQPQQQPTSETKNVKTIAPLQVNMLKTMNSHDEFIRRVKQKNP